MVISQFTLGCMQFVGESPEETTIETVEKAVELGINHIETARGYGNSEERVGKALKGIFKHTKREDLYITTKIGPDSDVNKFKKNFETSMNLLGLDYLDNLDFHGPGSYDSIKPAMGKDGCLGFVRDMMDQGVVKHFGFSTHGYPQGVMDLVNTEEFESINLHYYYFYQGLEHVVKRARELDMGIFIISPNNQGGRLHSPTDKLVEACSPLHPMHFTHRWLLNKDDVHTLSCGPANPEHLDLLLAEADYDGMGEARDEFEIVMANMDKVYRSTVGDDFCTTCNLCLPCPEDINIPGLLNLNNMTTAFEMKEYAQGRYSHVESNGAWVLGMKGDKCTKCGDCLPLCPENIDIPNALWRTHERLHTDKVGRPRWEHEGDLTGNKLSKS